MKRLRLSLGLTLLALVAITGIALLTLFASSSWLDGIIRSRLVATIRNSTGARATIGAISISPLTLTGSASDIVIHGNESTEEPPLFAAESVTVHLGITSLLHRKWFLDSVSVVRPKHYLVVRADGSTNLPARHQQDPASLLLSLHVRKLRMADGLARVNLQEFRYDLTGSAVQFAVAVNRFGNGYSLRTATENLSVISKQEKVAYQLRAFSADGELQPDKLFLTHLTLQSPFGELQASGAISHFAHLEASVNIWGTANLAQLARLAALKSGYAGDIHFAGIIQKQPSSPGILQAKVNGQDLSAQVDSHRVQRISMASDVRTDQFGTAFSNVVLSALGARIVGHGMLSRQGQLQAEAQFRGLALERLQQVIPNSGPRINSAASGHLRVFGPVTQNGRGLTVESQSTLTALPGSLPLSGSLGGKIALGGHSIEISDTHLLLAGTQVDLEGRVPDEVNVTVDSPDVSKLHSLIERVPKWKDSFGALPTQGSLHVAGTISKLLGDSEFDGVVGAANWQFQGQQLISLQTRVHLQRDRVRVETASVRTPDFIASADGTASLFEYRPTPSSNLQFQVHVSQANVGRLFKQYGGVNLPIIQGVGSAAFTVSGSKQDPVGSGTVTINSLNAYGQLLNEIQLNLRVNGRTITVDEGRIEAGPASLSFGGAYTRSATDWMNGQLALQVESAGFPIASLSPVRRFLPDVDAQMEVNARIQTGISVHGLTPSQLQGFLHIRHVALKHVSYGNLLFDTKTEGGRLSTNVSGDLAGKQIGGSVRTDLGGTYQTVAEIAFGEIRWSDVQRLFALQIPGLNVEGSMQGRFHADGPLTDLSKFRKRLQVDTLRLQTSASTPEDFGVLAPPKPTLVFENQGPLTVSAMGTDVKIESFHIIGPQTNFDLSGDAGWRSTDAMDLKLEGLINLALLQQFKSGVQATGSINVTAHAVGTWKEPELDGRAVIQNGKILAANLANGLTDVNGAVRFDGTRARIEKLQAKSGGGQIGVSGSVTYEAGAPLVYNLQAEARDTRFRYANAVSVTGNAQLRLTGTSQNGLLSGGVTINRAVLNTDADLGNILASTAAPVPVAQNQRDLLTGLQMDVHIDSSDDLVLSTALSQNVQTDIDLHLRGAPDRPVLLGTITANQGDIKLFGAKYTINRGVINFVNAVKLEPVLDLDLQTETRGIAVDITVSGTPNKLNLNYRSDPPLQPKDIIALLTVGQAPSFTTASVGNAQVTNDNSALRAGANTLLGQAASPVSNRLSKLFGITNIKIDPLVQGITNTPQARLTLEQQISRDITVTYITNLAETSEQIFRFEWALTPQYSVIAIRDDNGEFGIDVQYRKRFGSH